MAELIPYVGMRCKIEYADDPDDHKCITPATIIELIINSEGITHVYVVKNVIRFDDCDFTIPNWINDIHHLEDPSYVEDFKRGRKFYIMEKEFINKDDPLLFYKYKDGWFDKLGNELILGSWNFEDYK